MTNVLNFRPHPAQERFLNQLDVSGRLVNNGGSPQASETSTPNQTDSQTPARGKHKGFQSTAVDVEEDRQLLMMAEPPKNSMVFMTRLISMACSECGHQWEQPAEKGRCPKCHSDLTEPTDARVCHAARV